MAIRFESKKQSMMLPQNWHLADNTSGCYPSYSSCSVEESAQTLLLEAITNIEYQPSVALGTLTAKMALSLAIAALHRYSPTD
jgi:D-Tyr-tRNAtyr deacylase